MTNKSNELQTVSKAPQVECFFKRLDWLAFWAAFILSFVVYLYTLAPTVTLEDSGELAVAGDYLGVPHPPGYPIWTMLAWIFSKVFFFVPYRGQPNPAWSIGLMSAVFGALAAGITAMLICRSGTDMLHHAAQNDDKELTHRSSIICWIGGVVGSLLFAFSPVMWSQSVIVEVYSLNAFFLVIIFLLTYRWMRKPTNALLYVTGFIFGLGLTNYQVLLLAALPLVIVIMLKDINLFRDLVIVGIVFIVSIAILQLANAPSQPGFPKPAIFQGNQARALMSNSAYFWTFAAGTLVVVMCIVIGTRKSGSPWPLTPSVILGIAIVFLVYMIARIPRTPPHPFPLQPGQSVFDWRMYYMGFLAAMAVLIALCIFLPKGRTVAIAFVTVEITLAILLRKGVLLGLVHPPNSFMMFIHPTEHSWWFVFYLFLNFAILTTAFFLLPHGKVIALTILLAELGVAFYAYMPIVSDLRNPPMNWGYPRTWEGFKHAITRGQYEKIKPADVFSATFIDQIGSYFTDLRVQFTLPLALLGFLPFSAWRLRIRKFQINALYVAIALAVISS
ncbi:MAG: DUF2723 domain-containing protein, partial [Lentisphaerae bacterium]|nr:DUF2723 domain-containing protein [Lentisphaerota bacterium]